MKIYNTKNISNFIGKICFIAEDLKIDLDFDKMSGNCWRVKLKLGPSEKKTGQDQKSMLYAGMVIETL